MASRDDEAMQRIVEEERRRHRRSGPARLHRYFQIAALEAPRHQFVGFEPGRAAGYYYMGARIYNPTLRLYRQCFRV